MWAAHSASPRTGLAADAGAGGLSDGLEELFPVFRAHPLFFQTFVAGVFEIFGLADISVRWASVAFGVGTVLLVYRLGRLLYNPRVGLIAAFTLALMPYHVVLSR